MSNERIYIGGPLFTPWDRLRMCKLANAIQSYSASRSIPAPEIFVPFRDSNNTAPNGPDRSNAIFRIDIAELDKATKIVALNDGLIRDCGATMELGYCAASGKMTFVGYSNFLSRRATSGNIAPHSSLESIIGIEYICVDSPNSLDYYSGDFESQQVHHEADFHDQVAKTIVDAKYQGPRQMPSTAHGDYIYFDHLGGKFAESAQWYSKIRNCIQDIPGQFATRNARNYDAFRGASADLSNLLAARLAVFNLDGIESDPDTGYLVGVALKREIPFIIFQSSGWSFVSDAGQHMISNLMLEQGAAKRFDKMADLISWCVNKWI